MKLYYVHVPGWVYAGNFYGRNERDARKNVIRTGFTLLRLDQW